MREKKGEPGSIGECIESSHIIVIEQNPHLPLLSGLSQVAGPLNLIYKMKTIKFLPDWVY